MQHGRQQAVGSLTIFSIEMERENMASVGRVSPLGTILA